MHLPSDALTEVQTEAPDDIRSALMSALDAQESPTTESDEPSGDTRPRDATGKFVKADAAPSAPEPTEPALPTREPVKSEAEPPANEAPPEPTGLTPPDRWSPADKEAFAKIPADAQEFVMRRYKDMEADYTRKTQEQAAFRRDYEPVHQMFAPFEDQIRQSGFTKAGLIQAWADVERKLSSGQAIPVIRDLVQNYRVDRDALARELGISAAPAADGTQPEQAPAAQLPRELTETLQTLIQRQQQIDQHFTRAQQAQQAEAQTRVMSTITAFREAKNASGALLHPHYDDLESDMVAYLEAARRLGQEPSLDDLYDKAVWANPSTRDKVLASQRAAEVAQRTESEKKAREEARAKAERARRAGSSVTGAPGTSQAAITAAKADAGSVRDALLAAIDEHADA